jgi:hypothetical protein
LLSISMMAMIRPRRNADLAGPIRLAEHVLEDRHAFFAIGTRLRRRGSIILYQTAES